MNRTLTAASALLISGLAWGWAYTGPNWQWRNGQTQPYTLNVSSFAGGVGTPAEVEDALVDAMDVWNTEPRSFFRYVYGGVTTQTSWSGDNRWIVQYHTAYDPGTTLARAQWWNNGAQLTDCDIRFYPGNAGGPIAWTADPTGAVGAQYDLTRTAIHEFGHCAGLAHVNDITAIMYPNSFQGTGPADRTINADDEGGIRHLYGAEPDSGLVVRELAAPAAGRPFVLRLSGALPFETIHVVASTNGVGAGPCPRLLDNGAICMDILAPIQRVATATADSDGEANVTLQLPAGLANVDLGIQVAVLRGPNNRDSVLSDAYGWTVAP